MIAALIRWSARNLVLILIAAVLATGAGVYALRHVPLDAIPDLSDTQVIIYTEYSGQAPQVIEDQITYPLSTAMLSVPKARVVRGFSYFGVSFVYVIFEDGTDIYWARSRVLEYLSAAARTLPAGVTPSLGPDATGVGWVYQYAVMAEKRSLAELRSTQDWQVRFAVARAEGVAEVASLGGFVKQYSVVVDPRRLKGFDISLDKVRNAIRASNMDVGGRVVELAGTEFMVRGRGYLRGIEDHRADRPQVGRRRARPRARRGARRAGPRRAARRRRAQRRGRGRLRHCHPALRPERPVRDRERQGASRRDPAEPAGGNQGSSRSTTARTSSIAPSTPSRRR